MGKKIALITGITGQDGSYLAELLLEKGYEVHGLTRRVSTFNRQNIQHIFDTEEKREKYLHYGDMADLNSIVSTLKQVRPDEVYNLAAQSHVKISFEVPFYTAQADALGVLSLLEAVRLLELPSKIYQASTSELYSGDKSEVPQNEKTSFKPRSPYGAAKLYAFEIARIYRESYKMFITNGILFNHESPRRGFNFLSRKVVRGVAAIHNKTMDTIELGNLDAYRDWGYAPEYMEAAWLMLQQKEPSDYVIATGKTHSVREFTEKAFQMVGITLKWEGSGLSEKGIDTKTDKICVIVNKNYFRPNEVDYLYGDSAKAKKILGWEAKTTFEELIKIMIEAEIHNLSSI